MKTSVIIPAYNAEEYLANTIYSVLKQVRPPEEIIVVDDGSSDDTAAIAQGFSPRVLTIKQDNEGAAAARNTGAEAATGDALMFLDADDVLGPNALDGLLSALYRNPGTIALCPWNTLQFINGQWQIKSPNTPPRRFGQDDLSAWLSGWFHTPCSVLWSREAYEQTGPWDERISVNDDGEIMMRAMIMDISLVRASYGRSYYRRLEAESESLSDARFSRSGLESRLLVLDKVSDLLEQQDKLDSYSFPLSEAYELIANDCPQEYPDLYDEATKSAEKYGGYHYYRLLKRYSLEYKSKVARFCNRATTFLNGYKIDVVTQEQFLKDLESNYISNSQVINEEKNTPNSNRNPLVSVIIPTYNRRESLKRALNSVSSQTFEDYEVIVIDDASEDDTEEMVGRLAKDDKRVRYYRLANNSGASAARNVGLTKVRGIYIAFLDSDDEWRSNKLSDQIQKFGLLPEDVGLLYTGVETIFDNGYSMKTEPEFRGHLFIDMIRSNVIYGGGSNVMIKYSVFKDIGFFDEKLPANEDWDYWIRISRNFKVDFINEISLNHYKSSANNRKSLVLKDDIKARMKIYRKYKKEMQERGIASEFLLETARRNLIPEYWNPQVARINLAEAFTHNFFSVRLYIFIIRSIVPYKFYLFLRSKIRKFIQHSNRYNLSV